MGPASLELSQLVPINLNCFRYMLPLCHFPYIIFWVDDVYMTSLRCEYTGIMKLNYMRGIQE